MASTLWYRTDLDLEAARATLQQAMNSLGVTRFEPPDDQFTGTDDPMQAHRRRLDFAAQVNNSVNNISSLYGLTLRNWISGSKIPINSYVQLRLYAESTGTTIANGIGVMSMFATRKENEFHQRFSQAWREHDSSLTSIEHPGYLM